MFFPLSSVPIPLVRSADRGVHATSSGFFPGGLLYVGVFFPSVRLVL